MLTQTNLGPTAFIYLRNQLSLGKAFASNLLSLPLEEGEINSFLPPDIESLHIEALYESIQLRTGLRTMSESKDLVTQMIAEQLASEPQRCFIAEAFEQVGDPSPLLKELPYVTHKSEVYFLLERQRRDPDTIRVILNYARAYPSILGLVSLPKDVPSLNPGSDLTDHTMEILALHTYSIIVGAYDEEGYIVWRTSSGMVAD